MITDKYAVIGEDIHKLIRIKDNEDWSKNGWRIHYKGNLYFVPVRDECKHGFEPEFEPEINR